MGNAERETDMKFTDGKRYLDIQAGFRIGDALVYDYTGILFDVDTLKKDKDTGAYVTDNVEDLLDEAEEWKEQDEDGTQGRTVAYTITPVVSK